ncbi:unnamed protein product [Protopolystoma xenopodis]|uniref:Uncharacterized protein n=1 Tax=Protopolystoma xenopodis TaxID=117903 RepID=A0A448WF37_9PLAT|nr:unnamed protein product [Protopolystoma xenopodis]
MVLSSSFYPSFSLLFFTILFPFSDKCDISDVEETFVPIASRPQGACAATPTSPYSSPSSLSLHNTNSPTSLQLTSPPVTIVRPSHTLRRTDSDVDAFESTRPPTIISVNRANRNRAPPVPPVWAAGLKSSDSETSELELIRPSCNMVCL